MMGERGEGVVEQRQLVPVSPTLFSEFTELKR
jgi:hypothetical protein